MPDLARWGELADFTSASCALRCIPNRGLCNARTPRPPTPLRPRSRAPRRGGRDHAGGRRRSLRGGDRGARGRGRRVHHLDLDGARALARKDAERLRALPLRGLPVGLKDIYDTADMPTEYGSAAYKGHRPAARRLPGDHAAPRRRRRSSARR